MHRFLPIFASLSALSHSQNTESLQNGQLPQGLNQILLGGLTQPGQNTALIGQDLNAILNSLRGQGSLVPQGAQVALPNNFQTVGLPASGGAETLPTFDMNSVAGRLPVSELFNPLPPTLTQVPVEDVNCQWSEWESWGPCTVTCGSGGSQTRYRNVLTDNGIFAGDEAPCMPSGGTFQDTQECAALENVCPPDCSWMPWNDWGICSSSCGNGIQLRDRFVKMSALGGSQRVFLGSQASQQGCQLEGDYLEAMVCESDIPCPPKPKNCEWAPWNEWNECSTPCGVGLKQRMRNVMVDNTELSEAWELAAICGLPGIYFEHTVCYNRCNQGPQRRFRLL